MANTRTKRTSKRRTRKNGGSSLKVAIALRSKRRQTNHRRRRAQRGGEYDINYEDNYYKFFVVLNTTLALKMLNEYREEIQKCGYRPTGVDAQATINGPLYTQGVASDKLIKYNRCLNNSFYKIVEINFDEIKRLLTNETTKKIKTFDELNNEFDNKIEDVIVTYDYDTLIKNINTMDKKLNPQPTTMEKIRGFLSKTS